MSDSKIEIQDYDESSFWGKCKDYAKSIGEEGLEKALQLYYVLDSEKCTAADKVTIYGALAYLVSPIDVIPDLVPVLGYTDDIALIAVALVTVSNAIDDVVRVKAKEKLKEWFS